MSSRRHPHRRVLRAGAGRLRRRQRDHSASLGTAKSVLFTFVYCFAVSWVLLKLVDKLVGLRVDEQAEDIGLDLAEHNETAYNH